MQQPPPQGYGYGRPPMNQGQGQGMGQNPAMQQHHRQQPNFQWIMATDSTIPPNAVQGGIEEDGRPLFIARGFHKGSLQPGKAGQHLEDGGCSISYGGKEVRLREYYVLCGDGSQLRWVEQNGRLSIQGFKPVEAGHEADGTPLYVAKTLYKGSQQIGKTGEHLEGGMNFAHSKKERDSKSFMVLAYL